MSREVRKSALPTLFRFVRGSLPAICGQHVVAALETDAATRARATTLLQQTVGQELAI